MAKFGSTSIEKLPLSATARTAGCSGMREHFVFENAESFTLP